MATKSLSPSQIAKIQEMHGASLRKANPFSDEAQDFIENSWEKYKAEIEESCVAAINRMLKRKWREQDGVIDFSVTSDGTTGPEWIEQYPETGKYTQSVLRSPNFRPTKKGTTTHVAVLKGLLWSDSERITRNIRAAAYAGTFTPGRKLVDPNAEVACLIRKKFSDEEIEAMGLWWIVAMHEPIADSVGDPGLLSASRRGVGRALYSCWVRPGDGWLGGSGFAFAVSQV